MAAVTASTNILSVSGSAFILVCYTILPFDGHFRHILILNLTVTDFLHAVNNIAISSYVLVHRTNLDPGCACVFNGFVGQVTSQATDCSILAITITTVYTITRETVKSTPSPGRRLYERIVLLSCSIWALPLFTGFLALGMRWYGPVTGSRCWIKENPKYLRYALTHGWRFLFIIIEIGLFIYMDVYLRRHYRMMAKSIPPWNPDPPPAHCESYGGSTLGSPISEASIQAVDMGEQRDNKSSTSSVTLVRQNKPCRALHWFSRISGLRASRSGSDLSADTPYLTVHKALLLNAYPLAYIILWLPAIANRLIEATGHSSTVMQFLQLTSQLVGLANALTYGWNERVERQLRAKFSKRSIASNKA
ncbi:G protein-coupled glucose receptor regulating Gpa2-domain-containing protein [Amanita rubescens]|nr:G protein-coupled glucose receptor regulating Gpa2-domain-containing protein [Amanita rubescens]